MNEAEKSSLKLFVLKALIVVGGIAAFFIIALSSFFLLGGAFISLLDADPVEEDDLVYVIDLEGEISEAAGPGPGGLGISPRIVQESLDKAKADNAEAVVLRVNSPGGTVAASQEIASIIDDFELPTVVSMADSATSGGYYISAAADRIKAQDTSTTGSIGVISVMYNFQELYDNLGIEVEVIKTGEYKDMGFETMTEEERQIIQDLSDEMYEHFVAEVSDYRDMDKEDVYEVATGEIMTGTAAYEQGLVDGLGGIDRAVDKAGELAGIEDPNTRWLEPEGLFDQLFFPMVQESDLLELDSLSEETEQIDKARNLPSVEFRYQSNF
ncbi:signal peptide peptidase SppA [Natranaerobius thermophilus]|uniref:Signal peptide peptidase SppA, 36K type n=1 Tax=Natranaerobius thermophilus (strain ATCC BAA-1301 / DSM 18059 / JW/NM-WN-LF) TaxID=457570 RepID=B2A2Q3_NATTJ|nr:signal peptide peptidase SppA [Natranaerobius thermophilus]ACB86271.1 signal peptide peptidase SppA, 36K type [Natranaerobius thermophilus JW/NM-WN-LF]